MDKLFCILIGFSCVMLATAQINAGALTENVTNSGCGNTSACFTDPAGCNPESGGTCLFVSTQSTSNGLNFKLRGESSGYIAVVLSTDTTVGGNDTTYICTGDNNTVQFFFATLDNNTFTFPNTSSIFNVTGSVSNMTIQCVFDVTGLNATTRNTATTFSVALASGSLTNGQPTTPTVRTIIPNVNLADPTSTNTVTTTAAPNTTAAANATTANANATTTNTTTTTAAGSGANINLQHSLSQALLIVLGVVAMSLL